MRSDDSRRGADRDHQSSVESHVAEMHRHDEHVMSALRGPWKDDIIGHVRDESKGLVCQVAELTKRAQSAGRWSAIDRAGLWAVLAAVVAGLAGVL